jgi:hypothetical protein
MSEPAEVRGLGAGGSVLPAASCPLPADSKDSTDAITQQTRPEWRMRIAECGIGSVPESRVRTSLSLSNIPVCFSVQGSLSPSDLPVGFSSDGGLR